MHLIKYGVGNKNNLSLQHTTYSNILNETPRRYNSVGLCAKEFTKFINDFSF